MVKSKGSQFLVIEQCLSIRKFGKSSSWSIFRDVVGSFRKIGLSPNCAAHPPSDEISRD